MARRGAWRAGARPRASNVLNPVIKPVGQCARRRRLVERQARDFTHALSSEKPWSLAGTPIAVGGLVNAERRMSISSCLILHRRHVSRPERAAAKEALWNRDGARIRCGADRHGAL